jgi:hypothetical protein
MEYLKIIDAIANLITTLGISVFMIFVFGRLSLLQKLSVFETYTIKVGLALTASGAFLNIFTTTVPSITEVILNVGLAVIFVWTALFHYRHFVKK